MASCCPAGGGKQYEHRKKRVGAPEGNRNAEKQIGKFCPIVTKPTHEVIAQENKVSPRTVKYAEQYAKSVDNIAKTLGNETKEKILSGDLKTNKQDVVKSTGYYAYWLPVSSTIQSHALPTTKRIVSSLCALMLSMASAYFCMLYNARLSSGVNPFSFPSCSMASVSSAFTPAYISMSL